MNNYSENIKDDVSLWHQLQFSILFVLQHFFTKCNSLINAQVKLQSKMAAKINNERVPLPVDRRDNLTEDEFISSYLNKSLPVIFNQEAINWPCTQKWNLDFLEHHLADTKFTIFDSPGLVEQEFETRSNSQQPYVVEEINARDLAQALKNGAPKYLRFSTIMDQQLELINDLNQNWLKKMRRCWFGVCYQNFIGAKGRITPLHAESTALFYIMADGEKKWTLIPAESTALLNPTCARLPYALTKADFAQPDLKKFPALNKITRLEAHLKKGDILFVPAWTWHQVENLTPSWGMSYSFTNLRGFIKHPTLVFVRVFLSKPSFFANLFEGIFSKKLTQSSQPYVSPKIFRD